MDNAITHPIDAPVGKILKVRLGYNANSSSLSAIVSLLLLGSAAATAAIGIVSAALVSKPEPEAKTPPQKL
jgi:hypothetical protein